MITQGMHLKDLVLALGWSYATLWSSPNRQTELVLADGTFEANPLQSYDSEYWNVEKLFSSSYKSCSFAQGSGYAGKVLKEGQPLWLSGIDVLKHSNTPSQAHFFKVAGIQTLLCIPWSNSVVELGSSSLLPRDPSLVMQITSFLSHMATSKQQMTNACSPIEGSFVSQELSEGSDDASFNGGLNRDQHVQSCSSLPPREFLAKSHRPTQHRTAAAEDNLREEVVAISGESDWRLEFASSEMLQKNLMSPLSPARTPRRAKMQQEGMELVDGVDFSSESLFCPLQQMPLLTQLEYNHSNSTSHSSSADGDTNNFLNAANGNSELQLDDVQFCTQIRNSNVSRKATVATGFVPWNATAQNSSPRETQKSSTHSNHALLQRSISMTHKITQLKASRQQQGAAEQKTIAAVRHSTVSTAEEVLSGHDEAAVNHMLAERKRRQKQKENFCALRSLIPFVSKMDRASILGDAISYVKQLTARVEELENLNRELEAQLPQHKRRRSSTVMSL